MSDRTTPLRVVVKMRAIHGVDLTVLRCMMLTALVLILVLPAGHRLAAGTPVHEQLPIHLDTTIALAVH